MSNLVIVESPTKARTLTKFLGNKYQIVASMGHIRDLPKGDLGVDVDHNFEPRYIVPRDKKKRVNELIKDAGKADVIYLASDPDREGEAIAWHIEELLEAAKSKAELKRVVFHEITEGAIKEAFEHPRDLDLQLVDAQQARRILDRLVGYKLSPLLWKKVKKGLSAGRVQTVALRLIVEREREIEAFKPVEYWTIEAILGATKFTARLIEKDGQKIEIGDQKTAEQIVQTLEKSDYTVKIVNKKEVRRFAPAPFTTSTLQQTAGNKLSLTAKRTMMLAQNLYEHGFITYMRTDSVNLSTVALDAARQLISEEYGEAYLPAKAKVYKSKARNAQEAHEAIRPSNLSLHPNQLAQQDGLTRDHARLYELIWKRTIGSQMNEALFDQTSVDIAATSNQSDSTYLLRATGTVLKFDGWLKLYGATVADEEEGGEDDDRKQALPVLTEAQKLDLDKILPGQHFTEPPPRYTEASLIKKLEELGIGRPSTYAPILSTIQERFYVERVERKFVPTLLGTTTADFLIKYFPDLFNYAFTAQMEDQLDGIAEGKGDWRKTIGAIYEPMAKKLEEVGETAEKVELPMETTDKICPTCGKNLVIRTGKFGKFLACSGFPDCKYTERLEELIDAKCPEDGGDVVVRKTKAGKTFYGCKNWPTCKYASWNKPKAPTQDTVG